jgi:F0F1-type ATP synthase assembly protein I
MNPDECKQYLIEGNQRLDPILSPLGYVFEISENGISSGGPFAAGFYKNGNKKIGLIYRSISGLGSVVYEDDQNGASHRDLMGYLVKDDASKLKLDPQGFSAYSSDGGDVFAALADDIQNFGLEFLSSSEDQFKKTLKVIKSHNRVPDSVLMEGIFFGMVVGGAIGYFAHGLIWGLLIGFVLGSIGGIYFDLLNNKKE